MEKNDIVNAFFISSNNYFDAGILIIENIDYASKPNVIYPAAFLLRHSAELLLKSLICDYSSQDMIIMSKSELIVRVNNINFNLETHSLLNLYDKLLEVASLGLFPLIEKNNKLRENLIKLDKIDGNGVYYRYPVSKKSPSSKTIPYIISGHDIAPDLSSIEDKGLLIGFKDPLAIEELDVHVFENIEKLTEIIVELRDYSTFK